MNFVKSIAVFSAAAVLIFGFRLTPILAQSGFLMSQVSDDEFTYSASVRYANYTADLAAAHPFMQNLESEDTVLGEGNDELEINLGAATEYVHLSLGASPVSVYVGFAPLNPRDTDAFPFFNVISLHDGERYLIALVGSFAQGTLDQIVINETYLMRDPDVQTTGGFLFIHSLLNVPAIGIMLNGEVVSDRVEFGDYYFLATEPFSSKRLVVFNADDPSEVVFDDRVYNRAGLLIGFAFVGTFSGEIFEGYGAANHFVYMGDVQQVDKGRIRVGDSIALELGSGQRFRYTLMLETATTLNIVLDGDSTTDAQLFLYDVNDSIIAGNDDYSGDNNRDAALFDQVLPAGTYTIEARSWYDVYPGNYLLSVQSS